MICIGIDTMPGNMPTVARRSDLFAPGACLPSPCARIVSLHQTCATPYWLPSQTELAAGSNPQWLESLPTRLITPLINGYGSFLVVQALAEDQRTRW